MKVSCIIPTIAGREELLKKLLSTISPEYQTVVMEDEKSLLAAKRNAGAKLASGEYFLFIDDDNYLEAGAIEAAIDLAERIDIGVVGFVACYDDKKDFIADGGSKRNYLTGFTKGLNTNAHYPTLSKEPYEVDEVANAFLMHSELFHELYGFDEKNFPIDLDEADFCRRVKNLGLKVMMHPKARCYHKSQTYSAWPDFRRASNAYFLPRNKLNYQRKHLNALSYWVHIFIFLPVHICVYTASLLWRKKFSLIPFFILGTFHGIIGHYENQFENKKIQAGVEKKA